jgi:hypothetical protein
VQPTTGLRRRVQVTAVVDDVGADFFVLGIRVPRQVRVFSVVLPFDQMGGLGPPNCSKSVDMLNLNLGNTVQ